MNEMSNILVTSLSNLSNIYVINVLFQGGLRILIPKVLRERLNKSWNTYLVIIFQQSIIDYTYFHANDWSLFLTTVNH